MTLAAIRETVFLDFEFQVKDGGLPRPVCVVAREYKSRRLFRCWLLDEAPLNPPFATGPDVLVVAFYASAEMGCYLQLGWEFPRLLLDEYAEFRLLTNGKYFGKNGLLQAMQWVGLDGIEATKKDAMRDRILAGGVFNADEQRGVLDYCESDVNGTEQLFFKLIDSHTNLYPALWRGEYMKAVAQMEHTGVPLDVSLYRRMAKHWPQLQTGVIDKVNETIPVYEHREFRMALFERWLDSQGLLNGWPQTPAGLLATDDDTFKEKAELYPVVEPLRLARQMTNKLEQLQLTIGPDGRNRCLLSPFTAKTGRNAPSTVKFIFNTPSFLRNLIQPPPGKALAYIDWEQQEFGIAAALSGDGVMLESYRTGDCYLAFAKLANAVPAEATKATHPAERELFKNTILGLQYQMGPNSLACRLGVTLPEARHLLEHHHRIYSRFWQWSDAVCDYGQIYGELTAVFGWKLHQAQLQTIRTLRNFPMQANASEMLRLGCAYAAEAGVALLATAHDAICIEADEDEIDHAAQLTQTAMRKASEAVLAGFPLRSKVEVSISHPQHFPEGRGAAIWSWIQDQLCMSTELGGSYACQG